ncbi:MAG: hypothetical protein ACJ8J3_14670 [Burkholderia ambifaria]
MKSEQTAPTHLFATIRALTERGGRVTNATSGLIVAPPPALPRHRLAVRGATTARGGGLREATGTWDTGARLGKAGVVGNQIHYADGSASRIISGLGLVDNGGFQPLAFVGSELDNGDVITDSPERDALVTADAFTVGRRPTVAHRGKTS